MSDYFRWLADESGQDLIEYALLGAFVSLAVVVGAKTLGSGLNTWYNGIGGTVSGFAASVP